MKKKSPRGIPDFAPKKPHMQHLNKIDQAKPAKPAFDAPKIKPQATNQKSGRRGS